MATNSLPGAIVAAFLGDGGCTTAYPGGVWVGEAQEGTVLPYCEVEVPAGDIQQTSGKPYVETNPVIFRTWAEGLTAAETANAALLNLFNKTPTPFSLDTDRLLAFLNRSGDTPAPSDRRDAAGNPVWKLELRYDALIQRSKP